MKIGKLKQKNDLEILSTENGDLIVLSENFGESFVLPKEYGYLILLLANIKSFMTGFEKSKTKNRKKDFISFNIYDIFSSLENPVTKLIDIYAFKEKDTSDFSKEKTNLMDNIVSHLDKLDIEINREKYIKKPHSLLGLATSVSSILSTFKSM